MTQIMYQVHLWFGIAMVFYFLFPLLTAWIRGRKPEQQTSVLKPLHLLNRIGQGILVIQFLSGGMIMTQAKYTVAWMITITVLLVVIGAFTGMMAKPLRLWLEASRDGKEALLHANKVLIFSALNALAYASILYFMYHPAYQLA